MSRYSTVTHIGRRHRYRALVAVDSLTRSLGYPPTVREVAKAIEVKSIGQTHDALCALKESGYIDWQPLSARTLRVTQRGREALL